MFPESRNVKKSVAFVANDQRRFAADLLIADATENVKAVLCGLRCRSLAVVKLQKRVIFECQHTISLSYFSFVVKTYLCGHTSSIERERSRGNDVRLAIRCMAG
jgi:hypothetical protein